MAFYFLNCSIDAPDVQILSQEENLKFNDQESIIELIVEKVLGFESAIVEQDEVESSPQETIKKSFSLDYYIFHENNFIKSGCHYWNAKEKLFSPLFSFRDVFLEIVSPPPMI